MPDVNHSDATVLHDSRATAITVGTDTPTRANILVYNDAADGGLYRTTGTSGAGDVAKIGFNTADIGVTLQAYFAGLQSIGGLTTSANQMIYTTASNTYATTTITSYARTLIDDIDAAAARSTLGLTIGTNVQAYSAILAALVSGYAAANVGDVFKKDGSNGAWSAESGGSNLSIPVRNTILSGPSTWLVAGSGLQVLSDNGDAVATIAEGFNATAGAVDRVFSIPDGTAWSSLAGSSTVYLWVEHDGTTLTTGSGTLAPAYGPTAPTSPANGQWWFNTATYEGSEWDGSAWVTTPRLYVGQATTDGSGVTAVVQYAYNGTYESGIFSIATDSTYSLNAHLGVPKALIQVFARESGAERWALLSGGHIEQRSATSATTRAGIAAGYGGMPGTIALRTGGLILHGNDEFGVNVNGVKGTTGTSNVTAADCFCIARRIF